MDLFRELNGCETVTGRLGSKKTEQAVICTRSQSTCRFGQSLKGRCAHCAKLSIRFLFPFLCPFLSSLCIAQKRKFGSGGRKRKCEFVQLRFQPQKRIASWREGTVETAEAQGAYKETDGHTINSGGEQTHNAEKGGQAARRGRVGRQVSHRKLRLRAAAVPETEIQQQEGSAKRRWSANRSGTIGTLCDSAVELGVCGIVLC
jgi:hypothetical protein